MQHQQQHVISAWLLKAFARREGDRSFLTMFDKTTGAYEDHEPADFMVEVDGHSTEVEREISRLEGPAAAAARTLRKRTKGLCPGRYAVTPNAAEARIEGPPVSDMGVVEGMRLLVSEHAIGAPTETDRQALATYAGLCTSGRRGLKPQSCEAWHDDGWIARTAATAVQGAVAKVRVDHTVTRPLLDRWLHREGCRLVFGYSLYSADDRSLILGRRRS